MHGGISRAMRLPIRAQLLLLGLAVGLPAASLFAWHALEKSNEARQEAYARVTLLAGNVATQLDLFLADQEAMLARVAERYAPHQGADGAAFERPMHVRLLRRADAATR